MAGGATPAFDIRHARIRRGNGPDGFELYVPQLHIDRGAQIAFLGPSGCGKSTLLELLCLTCRVVSLERFRFGLPGGDVVDLGQPIRAGSADVLAQVRCSNIGCVVQTGALLAFASVRQNISIARDLLRMPKDDTVARLARRLGIERLLGKRPAALSVGERQRVAIARALAHRPQVLIADEPTAALDGANADRVMEILVGMGSEFGVTLIMATHDRERAERFRLQTVAVRSEIDPQRQGSVSVCAY